MGHRIISSEIFENLQCHSRGLIERMFGTEETKYIISYIADSDLRRNNQKRFALIINIGCNLCFPNILQRGRSLEIKMTSYVRSNYPTTIHM
jgi:hypothetical protein